VVKPTAGWLLTLGDESDYGTDYPILATCRIMMLFAPRWPTRFDFNYNSQQRRGFVFWNHLAVGLI